MGLFYSKTLDNGANLAVWEITETEEELKSLCVLPTEEQEELDLCSNPQRRRERLAVRVLLDRMFEEKVYLSYHDNGRPYLKNNLSEISISHTKRFACVLMHPELSVGVDIESLDRNFTVVEQRALNEEERNFLSDRQLVRQLQLAILWSAKEALFKYMSQNDVDFARRIRLEHFMPHEEGELDAIFYEKDKEEIQFCPQYQILDDHILVWVVDDDEDE